MDVFFLGIFTPSKIARWSLIFRSFGIPPKNAPKKNDLSFQAGSYESSYVTNLQMFLKQDERRSFWEEEPPPSQLTLFYFHQRMS